ncbi:HD domain-containing protein [Desulfoluna spongiiphila]|uniref:Putative hydrolases of HD superfamily n=1 Tax=Desulfoluna spongiiphila TaxID=419481 RepID=A0A1G5BWS1_9BACT|nr:HD domain-containing protein [Desulfoluna spongiiphila]SCX94652.1 putative hydrolases of HD superfamily [Desulfoluna spongiiphila]VVS93961.1 hd domain [Desulfoluna spongiiphila]
MERIADFLFEAGMLKRIPRSGYHFLGGGKESIAEHSFMITTIAFALSRMDETVDAGKLLAMCLVHDLPEARTGDLNYVQKKYCSADEARAVADQARGLPFGKEYAALVEEFNACETLEARLAKDADQLAFVLDLRTLMDTGHNGADKWLAVVLERLVTEPGRKLADAIVSRAWDDWWLTGYSE